MDEDGAVEELRRAHAELVRLTGELAEARERRRQSARRLVEAGYGPSWIAQQLGVTRQAVDGFLRYKERRQR